MKILSFTIALIALSCFSFGQNYSPKKFDEVKGKSRGAVFVGMDDEGYVYTTSMKITHLGIVAFNTLR